MLYSLDRGIRPLSALAGEVYRRVRTRLDGARVRESARQLPGVRMDKTVLSTLTPKDADDLSRYLLSPDFDHVTFGYALHRRLSWGSGHRQYEEIVTAVRAEIIEGLRHFTRIEAVDRTLLADVLLRLGGRPRCATTP
ncbi:hypothetical protein GA0074694_5881 [Micromonospora inyonensis]|uniref:Uncharacterized protein n=1 Tax=Micromonospora inyonensis TaxID=47866 RepID=A0A1C6SNM2_9ACTN|nr:hypothetical protein GA0074694_5881 [Micromonospora inyonensis]